MSRRAGGAQIAMTGNGFGCARHLRRAAVLFATTASLASAPAVAQTDPAEVAQTDAPAVAQTDAPGAPVDRLNPYSAAAELAGPSPYGLPQAPTAPRAGAGPPLFFTPYIGLQEQYTDNALLTGGGQQGDFITRGLAGMSADVNLGRLQGSFRGEAAYDWYAKQTDFNGKSLAGSMAATYSLLPDRLWIQTDATVTNGYTSTFGAAGVNRSGVDGRAQVGIYRIGPEFVAPLGGVADLALNANFGQVFYSDSGSTVPLLPPDDSVYQVGGRIDTGERLGRLQLLTTAQFEQDNHGYHTANGVQSVYFALTPRLRVIARAGYERLYQADIADISSPLLSAGFEFRPNPDSILSIEGGERYKRSAWAAEAEFKLSPTLTLSGYYREAIQPDQLYVATSFREFVSQLALLPSFTAPATLLPQENVYNQPAFAKSAELRLAWQNAVNEMSFAADWSNRRFLTTGGRDRTLTSFVDYRRKMRPDLAFTTSASYVRTFESPLYGPNENYNAAVGLSYALNSTTDVSGLYSHSHSRQLGPPGIAFGENVILVAIQKRF